MKKNKGDFNQRFYCKGEPFFCRQCDKVWQYLRDYTFIPDYLVDFPKLGCNKKICMKCEEKNGTIKEN